MSMERKLTAILSADVVGYSRLMGAEEEETLRTLTAYRTVMDTLIVQHRGRVVGSAGDSVLAEFASVVDAMQCAMVVQATLKAENANLPSNRRMEFRIGINLGDVMVQGEQIYGDGVNIAARLESLAEPGGIYISGTVYEHIKNKLVLRYEDLGEQQVKNIAEPVRVWRVGMEFPSPPVEQASSLHAARMAAPLEGQGEGASREVGSPKSQVQGPKSKTEDRKSRRVGIAHRSWAVAVAGLVLATGTIVAVRYLSFPSSTQHPTPSTQPVLSPQDSVLSPEAAPAALPLPDKPSIVVLPFANMSEDPKQDYFSDGLTEDLTSDLSQISSLFVISRNSAFFYKGKAVKLPEVSRELGVRYVVEGSVRKAGDQVRITAQLVDATKDQHLWSERYDRPLTEIFALQDEIRQKIVLALKVKLTKEEQERFQRAPTNNLEAYDYWLRGLESVLRGIDEVKKELNEQARQMFERAIELDPQYAGAYAGLGATYYQDFFFQWNKDRAQSLERSFELAQRAVALDDSLSIPHRLLSHVYLWRRQHEQAIPEAERAIALDPNAAENYLELGTILGFAGRPEEAIKLMEQAMRLNPQYPSLYLWNLGVQYRIAERYEEALAPLKKSLTLNPNLFLSHANLAICYAELGRLEEARAEAAEFQRLAPNFSLEVFKQSLPYKDPADLERMFAALRKAGLK
ncbi:MAG: adenylate/guanylate cyclase domain-containing protein [Deltaproteobacteria bacterium]|nr:adenylate/guanylate cyclase domain-containing protein [Deltaproteobacteria bacterium]